MSNKLGVAIGVIAGTAVVAGGVALAVPQVRDNLLNIGNEEKPIVSEKEENNVEQSNLQIEIDRLTAELTSKNSKLTEYETLISEKTSRIEELTAIESSLRAEIETYKELAGSNANYFEMINELTTQLTAVTSERDNLLIQVEQLTSDNEILTNNVAQLEAELAEAKEKLGNYIATENVDHLQVASYNGTWYLNGTYEDYLIIENGQVSRGNQAIKGVIQEQNKEMKMWLNDGTFETIKLTNNGTSIEINGAVYNNYIVNTLNEVVPDYRFCGKYSLNNKVIEIGSDHIISYFDGYNTLYGSYLVKSYNKNVAGNIVTISNISATFNNVDGSQFIVNYEHLTGIEKLINVDNNETFVSISSTPVFLVKSATSNKDYALEEVTSRSIKIIVKTSKFINLPARSSVKVVVVTGGSSSTGSYSYFVNDYSNSKGYNTTSFGTFNISLFNPYDYAISTDTFGFYIGYSNGSSSTTLESISIGGLSTQPVYIEQVKDGYLLGSLYDDFYKNQNKVGFTKTCDAIPGLVAGNYSADGLDLTINEDGSSTVKTNFIGGITFDSEHDNVNNFAHGEPTAENTYICDKGVMGLPGEVYPESKYGTYIDITNCPDFFMPNTEYFAIASYAINGSYKQTDGPTFVVSEEDFSKIKYLYVNFFDESMLTGTNLTDVTIDNSWLRRVHDLNNLSFGVDGEHINCYIGEVPAPSVVFTASAETDGHDIYHNVTATITETSYAEDGSLVSIDKLLTFKLKNNTEIIDATLNGSEITLTKE